jgi:hypothetical protein
MITARDIRAKCEKDIQELQKICNHPKTKQIWAEECWAPAHFTGRQKLICEICEKVLKVKGQLPNVGIFSKNKGDLNE